MKLYNTNMNRVWVVAGLVVVIGLIAWVAVLALSFRLTKAAPKDKASNVSLTATINFTFSQAVNGDASKLTIRSTPAVDGAITISQKTITFTPAQPLSYQTKYSFQLYSIESERTKKVIPSVGLTFDTISLADSIAVLQKTLPYTTLQFSIDYNKTNQTYAVDILNEPTDSAKGAALQYLANYGVNPANNTITFYAIPGLSGSNPVGP